MNKVQRRWNATTLEWENVNEWENVKVSKLTKLLTKALKRVREINDPELLKILDEAYELNSNIDNQLYKIRAALDVVKQFQ